jgi:undecaprenyl phosphate N,N'-diacetylbacillosamine 1-phosphate transferase
MNRGMYRSVGKRVFDIVIALLFCILLFPVFLVIYIILLATQKGAPFFKQVRPGKNGRLFSICKFKTMNDAKGPDNILLPDQNRVTAFGAFLRKTSLDEIPQLFNVLVGDMSHVGPRPLLVDYLPLYSDFQSRRHEVLPGITGWAQVNGRNAISWEQKFEYDIWYVDHISPGLDIKILFLTFLKVFKRENVNASDGVTMEKFKGNIS